MINRYKRMMIPAIAAAAAALALAADSPAGQEEKTSLVHRTGRVAVNLPENGSLRVCYYEDERFGIKWPGTGGMEFLGEGGFVLGFRLDGEDENRVLRSSSFLAAGAETDGKMFFEGADRGIRYPSAGCDDDGDGAVDEDPFDYLDNDSDGKTDEDFGVIGNEMAVTRGVEPRTGLTFCQSSYTWAYGHVRDFIGFTSVFLYPEDDDGRKQDMLGIETALCLDFAVGQGDHPDRSEDDKYFFIEKKTGNKDYGEEYTRLFAAVSDGGPGGLCAVVIFDFEAPGVSDQPIEAIIADTSLAFCGRVDKEGRKTLISRIPVIPKLSPGEKFQVDWALVFGCSEKSLERNISRAIETYTGVTDDDGKPRRWIVPARKAEYITLPGRLAPVWVEGKRKPAASIILPAKDDEDLEWIKVGENVCEAYERVYRRLMVSVEDEVMRKGEAFVIEGQFSDGTIFTTRINQKEIESFASGESESPGRLPDEFMSVFPNPFVSSLNIHLRITETPGQVSSQSGAEIRGVSSVRIYDVKGRLVRTILPEEYLHPGDYSLGWDGNDESSMPVSPGVYYCKLQIEQRTLTKRVILLR
ncbi:MAG: T9SS type A sorting domain-containing protein [Candidatus Krumholzibacteriota bacterium]|nr:T9SS type A sorting domain-containing protein [Candidatus Krumholzibacteriota bacterium]